MIRRLPTDVFSATIAIGLTVFISAVVVRGLFDRLGDVSGAVCAARIAVLFAAVTLVATATACLARQEAGGRGRTTEANRSPRITDLPDGTDLPD